MAKKKTTAHDLDEKSKFAIEFMRRSYWNAQAGRCGICTKPMTPKFNSQKINFDHVWPVSRTACRNGQSMRGNLLLTHKACNEEKANAKPTSRQLDFLREVNRALGYPAGTTALWDSPIDNSEATS